MPASLDFMLADEDENKQADFYSHCYNINKTKGEVRFHDSIDSIINAIQQDKEDSLTETYNISDISQLLLMEIMGMITEQRTVKKCRLCNKYFIAENLKNEYCNRIPAGEKKPCSEIGSIRSYQNKVKSDIPLTLYQRAYKTHFARIKKKRMVQNAFHIWAINAKQKLDAVRAGEFSVDAFEKWLKI